MTKPFVFVLMPFDSAFDDVYKLGIKEAANNAGGYCERVDEQIFEERMLDRIYNQINKADVIVADLTGKNPNVFYETGYAHALDKRVILLTSNADDIPFDLKHHYHIVYSGSISKLKDELTGRLKWYFENPNKAVLPSASQFEFYLLGNKIKPGVVIENTTTWHSGIDLTFELLNISNTLNDPIKFALETNNKYNFSITSREERFTTIKAQKEKIIFVLDGYIETIFPQCWSDISATLYFGKAIINEEIPLTLIISTESGQERIEFSVINREAY